MSPSANVSRTLQQTASIAGKSPSKDTKEANQKTLDRLRSLLLAKRVVDPALESEGSPRPSTAGPKSKQNYVVVNEKKETQQRTPVLIVPPAPTKDSMQANNDNNAMQSGTSPTARLPSDHAIDALLAEGQAVASAHNKSRLHTPTPKKALSTHAVGRDTPHSRYPSLDNAPEKMQDRSVPPTQSDMEQNIHKHRKQVIDNAQAATDKRAAAEASQQHEMNRSADESPKIPIVRLPPTNKTKTPSTTTLPMKPPTLAAATPIQSTATPTALKSYPRRESIEPTQAGAEEGEVVDNTASAMDLCVTEIGAQRDEDTMPVPREYIGNSERTANGSNTLPRADEPAADDYHAELELWLQITGFYNVEYRQNQLKTHRLKTTIMENKRALMEQEAELKRLEAESTAQGSICVLPVRARSFPEMPPPSLPSLIKESVETNSVDQDKPIPTPAQLAGNKRQRSPSNNSQDNQRSAKAPRQSPLPSKHTSTGLASAPDKKQDRVIGDNFHIRGARIDSSDEPARSGPTSPRRIPLDQRISFPDGRRPSVDHTPTQPRNYRDERDDMQGALTGRDNYRREPFQPSYDHYSSYDQSYYGERSGSLGGGPSGGHPPATIRDNISAQPKNSGHSRSRRHR